MSKFIIAREKNQFISLKIHYVMIIYCLRKCVGIFAPPFVLFFNSLSVKMWCNAVNDF